MMLNGVPNPRPATYNELLDDLEEALVAVQLARSTALQHQVRVWEAESQRDAALAKLATLRALLESARGKLSRGDPDNGWLRLIDLERVLRLLSEPPEVKSA